MKPSRGHFQSVASFLFCIFSCCTTHAINLELLPNMSTQSFVLAFRSHCADYTTPNLIVSDNASTFKRADIELKKLFSSVWNEEAAAFLSQRCISLHGIQFCNIPVKAPWWGGFYECLIGVVKMCLKKTLGKACISFEEFRILLKEVKAVVNSRSMTALPSDPNEPQALTPTCLLFGYATTQLPYPSVEADEPFYESVSLSHMAGRRAMLFMHFVNRFQHEYLAALREHHSHQQTQFHVSVRPLVGDLVLIHDESLPRTRWKLGVIEDLLTGPDKIPHAAIVRTARGQTSHPLSHLYPVEDTVRNHL